MNWLSTQEKAFRPVVLPSVPPSAYALLDLSPAAVAATSLDVTDAAKMEAYILQYQAQQGAMIAYGGYLERRTLYQRSAHFNASDALDERTIHLGVDFWVAAGTPVVAPFAGIVHSFQDNLGLGNYGPTILLAHAFDELTFYTLYGHLSRASLSGLDIGQSVAAGQCFAELGGAVVNGDYAPHLHFQVVLDLMGFVGDFPGVCSERDLEGYRAVCPDPLLLVGL